MRHMPRLDDDPAEQREWRVILRDQFRPDVKVVADWWRVDGGPVFFYDGKSSPSSVAVFDDWVGVVPWS